MKKSNKADKKHDAHFRRIKDKEKKEYFDQIAAWTSDFKLWQRIFGRKTNF